MCLANNLYVILQPRRRHRHHRTQFEWVMCNLKCYTLFISSVTFHSHSSCFVFFWFWWILTSNFQIGQFHRFYLFISTMLDERYSFSHFLPLFNIIRHLSIENTRKCAHWNYVFNLIMRNLGVTVIHWKVIIRHRGTQTPQTRKKEGWDMNSRDEKPNNNTHVEKLWQKYFMINFTFDRTCQLIRVEESKTQKKKLIIKQMKSITFQISSLLFELCLPSQTLTRYTSVKMKCFWFLFLSPATCFCSLCDGCWCFDCSVSMCFFRIRRIFFTCIYLLRSAQKKSWKLFTVVGKTKQLRQ